MTIELKDRPKISTAEAARQALIKIREADDEGVLKAENVVDAARHPDHELHRHFEWDDNKAGEQWRLCQARALIRTVLVSGPDDDDSDAPSVPGYVSLITDRKKPGGGYRPTNQVINNKELLAELEATAKRDIDGVLARYEMLKSLVAKVRAAAGIAPKKKK